MFILKFCFINNKIAAVLDAFNSSGCQDAFWVFQQVFGSSRRREWRQLPYYQRL